MAVNLYDLSIAIFMRDLSSMKKFLQKGEAWCDEQGKPHSVLLEGRLAPDMHALPFQVQTCCNHCKFVMERVGGTAGLPKLPDDEKTFAELYDRIDKTIAMLKTAKREDYNDTNKEVTINYPTWKPKFTAERYIQRFALTNFTFHDATAYLILRNAGVPVGKRDYCDLATIEQD